MTQFLSSSNFRRLPTKTSRIHTDLERVRYTPTHFISHVNTKCFDSSTKKDTFILSINSSYFENSSLIATSHPQWKWEQPTFVLWTVTDFNRSAANTPLRLKGKTCDTLQGQRFLQSIITFSKKTRLLTPRRKVILEKLIVTQLVERKYPLQGSQEIDTLTFFLFKIKIKIITPSMPLSPKWTLSSSFSD
jgi:hypothetical protein